MSTRIVIRTILDENYQLSNVLVKKKLNEKVIGILSEEDKYSFSTGTVPVTPPKPVQKPKSLQDTENTPSKPKLKLRDVLRKPENQQQKKPVHYTPMKKALNATPTRFVPPTKSSAENQAMVKGTKNQLKAGILDFGSFVGGAYAAAKRNPVVGSISNFISSDPAY